MFATITAITDIDDRAFMLALYRDYYGIVRHTIWGIVLGADCIEDLINDTFLKLIEKISILRTLDCCRLGAYVVYTGRSVAINWLKRLEVQQRHVSAVGDIDQLGDTDCPGDATEDRVINQQERAELRAAIAQLPERHKDLLYLRYYLEMDDAAIAEVLQIREANVRQYLTRARRAAKRLLQEGVTEYGE